MCDGFPLGVHVTTAVPGETSATVMFVGGSTVSGPVASWQERAPKAAIINAARWSLRYLWGMDSRRMGRPKLTAGPVRFQKILVRQARGSVNVKVEPFPGSLSAVMLPPIPRARSRLIVRPRPVPSFGEASERPTCSKGAKIVSRCSGGIPTPESRTFSQILFSDAPQVSSIVPPLSVNFTAFDRRLIRICSIFALSPSAITSGAHGPTSSEIPSPLASGSMIGATASSASFMASG